MHCICSGRVASARPSPAVHASGERRCAARSRRDTCLLLVLLLPLLLVLLQVERVAVRQKPDKLVTIHMRSVGPTGSRGRARAAHTLAKRKGHVAAAGRLTFPAMVYF